MVILYGSLAPASLPSNPSLWFKYSLKLWQKSDIGRDGRGLETGGLGGGTGIFDTLEQVVLHHFDPINIFIDKPWLYKKSRYEYGRVFDSREKVLSSIKINDDDELEDLINYLKSL